MESITYTLPGLILLATVFSYISYGRSKSAEEEHENSQPSLECIIFGDYGCAAKCNILYALSEYESMAPRCENNYCNCRLKSSWSATPLMSSTPNEDIIFTELFLREKEQAKFKDVVERHLQNSTNHFPREGSTRSNDLQSFIPRMISNFKAIEIDGYLINEKHSSDSSKLNENVELRTASFTSRRLLQVNEPSTLELIAEPLTRKVKIERIKKWRKKARMGGSDDDDEGSEEVEQQISPQKPVEKRRVKIKQPGKENLDITAGVEENGDVFGMNTNLIASCEITDTNAAARAIPEHNDNDEPPPPDLEMESKPTVLELVDTNPSTQNENVLIEEELLHEPILMEGEKDSENFEIANSIKNETLLAKPRMKRKKKKPSDPTKSGPKIQRIKKYRKKNKPVVKRKIKRRKVKPSQTDEQDSTTEPSNDKQNTELVDGNRSVSEPPDTSLPPPHTSSNLSINQKSTVGEPLLTNETGELLAGAPESMTNSPTQANDTGNQSVKPNTKLADKVPNKPRSVKSNSGLIEQTPAKHISENSEKILQQANILGVIPSNSNSLPDKQSVTSNLQQKPLKAEISKKRKTHSPKSNIEITDGPLRLENTEYQPEVNDSLDKCQGAESKDKTPQILQNITNTSDPSLNNAQPRKRKQALGKTLPSPGPNTNITELVNSEPEINVHPQEINTSQVDHSNSSAPLPQKETDCEPKLKNLSTNANEPSSRLRKKLRIIDKAVPLINSTPEQEIAGLEPQIISAADGPTSGNSHPRRKKQHTSIKVAIESDKENAVSEPQTNDTTSTHQPTVGKPKKQKRNNPKTPTLQGTDMLPILENPSIPNKYSVSSTQPKRNLQISEDILSTPKNIMENSKMENAFPEPLLSDVPDTQQSGRGKRRKKDKIIPEASIAVEDANETSTSKNMTPKKVPSTISPPKKRQNKLKNITPVSETMAPMQIIESTDNIQNKDQSKTPIISLSNTNLMPTTENITVLNKPPTTRTQKRRKQQPLQETLPNKESSIITPGLENANYAPNIDSLNAQKLIADILLPLNGPSSANCPRKRQRKLEKDLPILENSINTPDIEIDIPKSIIETHNKEKPLEDQLTGHILSNLADLLTEEDCNKSPNLRESASDGLSSSNTHPKKKYKALPKVIAELENSIDKPAVDTVNTHNPIEEILVPPIHLENTPTSDGPPSSKIHPRKRKKVLEKGLPSLENSVSTPELEINVLKPTIETLNKEIPLEEKLTEEIQSNLVDPFTKEDNNKPSNLKKKSASDGPPSSDPHLRKKQKVLPKVLPNLKKNKIAELENAKHEPTTDSLNTTEPTGKTPLLPFDLENTPTSNGPPTSDIHPKGKKKVLKEELPILENGISTPNVEINVPKPTVETPKKEIPLKDQLTEQLLGNLADQLVEEDCNKLPNLEKESVSDRPPTSDPSPKKKHKALPKVLPDLENNKIVEVEEAKYKPTINPLNTPKPVGEIVVPPLNLEKTPTSDGPPSSEINPKRKKKVLQKEPNVLENNRSTPDLIIDVPISTTETQNKKMPLEDQCTGQIQSNPANTFTQEDNNKSPNLEKESASDRLSPSNSHPKKKQKVLPKVLPNLVNNKIVELENAKPEPTTNPLNTQEHTKEILVPAFDLENTLASSEPPSSEIHPKRKKKVLKKLLPVFENDISTPDIEINIQKPIIETPNKEIPFKDQLTEQIPSNIADQLTEGDCNKSPKLEKESVSDRPSTSGANLKKQQKALPKVIAELENAKYEPAVDPTNTHNPIKEILVPPIHLENTPTSDGPPSSKIHPKKRKKVLEKGLPNLENSISTPELEINVLKPTIETLNKEIPLKEKLIEEIQSNTQEDNSKAPNLKKESASDRPPSSDPHLKKKQKVLPKVLPNLEKDKIAELENANHEPTTDPLNTPEPIRETLVPPFNFENTPASNEPLNSEIHPKRKKKVLKEELPVLENDISTPDVEIYIPKPTIETPKKQIPFEDQLTGQLLGNLADQLTEEDCNKSPNLEKESVSNRPPTSDTSLKKKHKALPKVLPDLENNKTAQLENAKYEPTTDPLNTKKPNGETHLPPIDLENISVSNGPPLSEIDPKRRKKALEKKLPVLENHTTSPEITRGNKESERDSLKIDKPVESQPSYRDPISPIDLFTIEQTTKIPNLVSLSAVDGPPKATIHPKNREQLLKQDPIIVLTNFSDLPEVENNYNPQVPNFETSTNLIGINKTPDMDSLSITNNPPMCDADANAQNQELEKDIPFSEAVRGKTTNLNQFNPKSSNSEEYTNLTPDFENICAVAEPSVNDNSPRKQKQPLKKIKATNLDDTSAANGSLISDTHLKKQLKKLKGVHPPQENVNSTTERQSMDPKTKLENTLDINQPNINLETSSNPNNTKLKNISTADKPSVSGNDTPQIDLHQTAQIKPIALHQDDTTALPIVNLEKIPQKDEPFDSNKCPKKYKQKIPSTSENIISPDMEINDGEYNINSPTDIHQPLTYPEISSLLESVNIEIPTLENIPSINNKPLESDTRPKRQQMVSEKALPSLEDNAGTLGSEKIVPENNLLKATKIKPTKLNKTDPEASSRTMGNTGTTLTPDLEKVLTPIPTNITSVPETEINKPPNKQQKQSGKPAQLDQSNLKEGSKIIPNLEDRHIANKPSSSNTSPNEQAQVLKEILPTHENINRTSKEQTDYRPKVNDILNSQQETIDNEIPLKLKNTKETLNLENLSNNNGPPVSKTQPRKQQEELKKDLPTSENISNTSKPEVKNPKPQTDDTILVNDSYPAEQGQVLKNVIPVVKYITGFPERMNVYNKPDIVDTANILEILPNKLQHPNYETKIHNTQDTHEPSKDKPTKLHEISAEAFHIPEGVNVLPNLIDLLTTSKPSASNGPFNEHPQVLEVLPDSENKSYELQDHGPIVSNNINEQMQGSVAKPNVPDSDVALNGKLLPEKKEKKLKQNIHSPLLSITQEPLKSALPAGGVTNKGILPPAQDAEQISKEPTPISITQQPLESTLPAEDITENNILPLSQNTEQVFKEPHSSLADLTNDTPNLQEVDSSLISQDSDIESQKNLTEKVEPPSNAAEDTDDFNIESSPQEKIDTGDELLLQNNIKPDTIYLQDKPKTFESDENRMPLSNNTPLLDEKNVKVSDETIANSKPEGLAENDNENRSTNLPLILQKENTILTDEIGDSSLLPKKEILNDDGNSDERNKKTFDFNIIPDNENGTHTENAPPAENSNIPVQVKPNDKSIEFPPLNDKSPNLSEIGFEYNEEKTPYDFPGPTELADDLKSSKDTNLSQEINQSLNPDMEEASSEFFSLKEQADKLKPPDQNTILSKKLDGMSSKPDEEDLSSEFFHLNKQVDKLKSPSIVLDEVKGYSPNEEEISNDFFIFKQKPNNELKPTGSAILQKDLDEVSYSPKGEKTSNENSSSRELADPQFNPPENPISNSETEINQNNTPHNEDTSSEFFSLNKLANKVKPLADTILLKELDKTKEVALGEILNPNKLAAMWKPTENTVPFEEMDESAFGPHEENESSEFFNFNKKVSELGPPKNELLPKESNEIGFNRNDEEEASNEFFSLSKQANIPILKPLENAELLPEAPRNVNEEFTSSDDEEKTLNNFFNLNELMNKFKFSGRFKEFDDEDLSQDREDA